ncbi:hypothetical protein PVOR_00265 [Paenibacillus vortex V453]|uniref:Uncharacterized protein n=2 Tax=Paenibacillus TaxID=44249 RepID=A0A163IFE6_9BACL|nr:MULTISPECIES: hypothetical protein [Paenibacillus]AWP30600.1 hypothetical protein B9D94_30090 [Paenibacillus sp. Cedars]EFU43621.1 hypothetical protein PVOR_00265 [Paenibacillus vortex V453]ANA79912.1 hypothetical protein A3958_07960 [Paenibacillus glucanolyticus]AVV56065.1 hypothetical protein C7121_07880 [Paenibacillus glucanolyticus]ETT38293.1 hypothetical protein C169_11802 [Paenibacillus sp. FSL R5-808]
MDPIRRIIRIICSTLGLLLIASVTPVPLVDITDSAAATHGMEASEGNLPESTPVPKTPEPVRLKLEDKRHVSLLSLNNVTCCTETDMFLILKHMLLEPLKFRSNYVDSHA